MKSPFKTIALLVATIFLFTNLAATPLFANSAERKTTENSGVSLNTLYENFIDYNSAGKYKEAGEVIERMLEIEEGGIDHILKTPGDEYPRFILDLIFDYGTCLIQQERWQEARDCYRYLVDAYPLPRKFIH